MTEDENAPVPEPSGALVPPVRDPWGPGRPPIVRGDVPELSQLVALLGRAVTLTLDALDAAGDAVAERIGLRHRPSGPPPSPPSD
jgi:hypothetical protein